MTEDVHTLKALPPTTSGELVLRGGCCKAHRGATTTFHILSEDQKLPSPFFQVGSGADFLEVKEAKLGPNGELETQKNSPNGDLRLVV